MTFACQDPSGRKGSGGRPMIRLLTLLTLLLLTSPTVALDTSHRAPAKATVHAEASPADPAVIRQGGDTILDAVPLAIPTNDLAGTTVGYTDDYDEVCPYNDSVAPDVVYTFTPDSDMLVIIDMLGSTYDTKIYVYDENLSLVACNDDFYSDYVSRLENVPLIGGVAYYLVIDGYGAEAGDYVLTIEEFIPCELDPFWSDENEPPLEYDYVDNWNGGCNTDPLDGPFQDLYPWHTFAGVSGWYLAGGSNNRDTDWYRLVIPTWTGGVLDFTGDAEQPTYLFELGPQDCGEVAVLQSVEIGPCQENVMTIVAEPGSVVWFWVGPTTFESPDGSDVYEYDYILEFPWVTAVEDHTLSSVKNLFR